MFAQLDSDALGSTLPDPSAGCDLLSENEILDYVRGRLETSQLNRISRHVRSCRTCQVLVHEGLRLEHPRNEANDSAWTWNANFAPGVLLAGRYLIRRFVGRGAMGEVYEALDNGLRQRCVALKTVIASASDNPLAESRLRNEVMLAQLISHANVCRIHNLEIHKEEDEPAILFLTMEFIEGKSLGSHLREHGPFAAEEVRRIAGQLLLGLQAAHDAHVLHRDLKSDNVMLRYNGTLLQPVITDFGLARALDPGSPLASDSQHLVGTVPYMAPEQLRGDKLGPPSDIFALGVVLFEMLTGRLPFKGGIRTSPSPPSRAVPGTSPLLDALVLKCLQLEAKDRYASATLALSALDQLRPHRRRRWDLMLALVACVLGGLIWLMRGGGQVLLSAGPATLAAAATPSSISGIGSLQSAPEGSMEPRADRTGNGGAAERTFHVDPNTELRNVPIQRRTMSKPKLESPTERLPARRLSPSPAASHAAPVAPGSAPAVMRPPPTERLLDPFEPSQVLRRDAGTHQL